MLHKVTTTPEEVPNLGKRRHVYETAGLMSASITTPPINATLQTVWTGFWFCTILYTARSLLCSELTRGWHLAFLTHAKIKIKLMESEDHERGGIWYVRKLGA